MCKVVKGVVLVWSIAGVMFAGPITYNVTVNTSSISGTAGSLDFDFNPGPLITQTASLQILTFSGGTPSGSPTVIGDVTGTLPGTLTFDNQKPFNDYFQTFQFGSTLSFGVSLFGPALSSPNGTATSGSTFAFSMFSNAAGTKPVLTTDKTNGFAFVVEVNLDGTTTATNFILAAVPEPGSFPLVVGAAIAVGVGRIRRMRRKPVLHE
jgi:hypothetical protein